MKAIVGKSAAEIAPKLLGFLSLARQAALRADLLRGEGGEICVVLRDEGKTAFAAGTPRHWVEVRRRGDRIRTDDGIAFRVVETLEALSALELATAVEIPGSAEASWRERVLFALRDEEVLGRVVRALLERGYDCMSFGKVAPGSVHPGTEFVLLVRNAPVYVVLEVVEEGLGHVFYEAVHATKRDVRLGLFLPWGRRFLLVSALGARLEQPCVRMVCGRLVAVDLEGLTPLDAVLSPTLPVSLSSVTRVPHGELRVEIPLRLERLDPAQSTERAELWRIAPSEVAGLANELACAEEKLAGLLAQVLRLGDDPEPTVFVWVGPNNREDAERAVLSFAPGFARARKRVANLLLPVRHAILPTLNDETLRSVFSLRQGVLTVVDFAKNKDLAQYNLPFDDFRPLREGLVEYALVLHKPQLSKICEKAAFDFEPIRLPPPEVESSASVGSAAERTGARSGIEADTPAPDEADSDTQEREPLTEEPVNPQQTGAARETPTLQTLAEAARVLIADPYSDENWLRVFGQSRELSRHYDARMALLRPLARCEPKSARGMLTAALGLTGSLSGRKALGDLDKRDMTREQALERALTLELAALEPPADLTAEERRALVRFPALVAPLRVPRLTWTAARAAATIASDPGILEDARLAVERNLSTMTIEDICSPLALAELDALSREGNRSAVLDFAEAVSFGPAERVFLQLAYVLRILALGHGIDAALLGEMSRTLEEARADMGETAAQVESALRTLERAHAQGRGLISLAGFEADPNLRTVLIYEGYMPPVHESPATRILGRGADLAALSAADAAEGVADLFDEATHTQAGGLEAMMGVVGRLRRAGHRDALQRLNDAVAAARNDGPQGLSDVLLSGLALGVGCSLDPAAELGSKLENLVQRAAGLQNWDLGLCKLAVLSAMETLPAAARREHAAAVFMKMREQGLLQDFSSRQSIRIVEQRVLFRLVCLLVVPADQGPEADRLRHAEWADLREIIRRDIERANQRR